MADPQEAEALKHTLRDLVSRFCRHDGRRWKRPILQTIDGLRDSGWRSVLFGGTLRSLLLGYLSGPSHARPRDIDIVVDTESVDVIYERFADCVHRRTRFGGLQLRRSEWQFDVWPLGRTWAFVEDSTPQPRFEDLPLTTFFNLEAIAVELWPEPGRPRRVFSGDDRFFSGLLDGVLEINRVANPFPELCVVRSLVLAHSIRFQIGPMLAWYIAREGDRLSVRTLEEVQTRHYGSVRLSGQTLNEWIRHVQDRVSRNGRSAVALPGTEQPGLWPTRTRQPRARAL